MNSPKRNPRREALVDAGVVVTKTHQTLVAAGSKWEVHFWYAGGIVKRHEARRHAQIYIIEEYDCNDVAFFANPATANRSFYAIFFTDWR